MPGMKVPMQRRTSLLWRFGLSRSSARALTFAELRRSIACEFPGALRFRDGALCPGLLGRHPS